MSVIDTPQHSTTQTPQHHAQTPQHHVHSTPSHHHSSSMDSSSSKAVSLHTLVFRSLKRTHDMFAADFAKPLPNTLGEKVSEPVTVAAPHVPEAMRRAAKLNSEYALVKHLPPEPLKRKATDAKLSTKSGQGPPSASNQSENQLVRSDGDTGKQLVSPFVQANPDAPGESDRLKVANLRKAPLMPKPTWHAPWKLYRVLAGHSGWVRCIDFEPGNEWFVTGAADRVIKIWDFVKGTLKLSLTGHISTIQDVVVSPTLPYLFSCGDDKEVKCWDLEVNKVVRKYHGHLSAVLAMSVHPTLDILVTAGRDSTARIWDMRTRAQIHCLTGHTDAVFSVQCQATDPQVLTGGGDSCVRLWDIREGRSAVTLTNHKKRVRSLAVHPTMNCFASASADNIKQWLLPDGMFVQNVSGHNAIVNSVAVNEDDVLVSGADNGTIYFWDWKSGYNFQRYQAPVQPGSIDPESGVFAMSFDKSGSRLVTCDADKTIKFYKEDPEATEETHPLNWKPGIMRKPKY